MTGPNARYEYDAEVVDLVRNLEQRAVDMNTLGYGVTCEYTTHTTGDEITETLTVHWKRKEIASNVAR